MSILYAIPSPLGGSPLDALPGAVIEKVRGLRDFVAEDPKTARALLGALKMPCPIAQLSILRLDEHTRAEAIPSLLAPLRAGRPLGLLSEAGCPAIADPGASLIEAAHRESFRVAPLVGPSSILLALMASGLEGQRFAFCGYLPREPEQRNRRIRALETRSRRERETQIFIETPYRNDALLAALLSSCAPTTMLCVASDLTLPAERIATKAIAAWRRSPVTLGRKPTVFLLGASGA
jgi:16S rRNA (cytidine1402-2'-O)-methyltransferase